MNLRHLNETNGKLWKQYIKCINLHTENASRNIPNIGKNVPDTMCGLGDIRNNF